MLSNEPLSNWSNKLECQGEGKASLRKTAGKNLQTKFHTYHNADLGSLDALVQFVDDIVHQA